MEVAFYGFIHINTAMKYHSALFDSTGSGVGGLRYQLYAWNHFGIKGSCYLSLLVIRDRTLWVIIKADWLKKKHRQTWCVVKSSVMLIDLGLSSTLSNLSEVTRTMSL